MMKKEAASGEMWNPHGGPIWRPDDYSASPNPGTAKIGEK
jgi:hypothetical protein